MIDLPSTQQQADHTCGAAALRSICRYFGAGPTTEAQIVADMGFGADGSDPAHVLRAVERYGLAARAYRPMSAHQLARCLARGRPVLLMLQAWADPPPSRGFADVWHAGHWVVAIGRDARGVTFADPSLPGARGWLTHADLDERWHDIEGAADDRVQRYGVEIWRHRVVHRERLTRLRPIG
jgi:predicted double-glycine peptidase